MLGGGLTAVLGSRGIRVNAGASQWTHRLNGPQESGIETPGGGRAVDDATIRDFSRDLADTAETRGDHLVNLPGGDRS